MNNFDSGKSIESIKKDVKIIDEPIIEVINEDEILFLMKMEKSNVFIGLIFDTNGNTAPHSNLSVTAKEVRRILPTQKHVVVIANDSDVLIFHKHDMMLLQKFTIPDTKQLFVSNGLQEILLASEKKVYFLELQPFEYQITECIKKCKGKEAMSIFETYSSSKFTKADRRNAELWNLNWRLSVEYLSKDKYTEAEESLSMSNFDPTDILTKYFPAYMWDYNGTSSQNVMNRDALIFLSNVLARKRKQILQEHQNPDQEYIDRAYLQGKPEVKASAWLEYIDFALIKCYQDLKKYKELADFFSSADRVYCTNIKEKVKK